MPAFISSADKKTRQTNIRNYALKSDDDPKPTIPYPIAYALKSDDGNNLARILIAEFSRQQG